MVPVSISHVQIGLLILLHCPEQKHNCVLSRFALKRLHLFVEIFLHPHFNSSWQALAASGQVVSGPASMGNHLSLSSSPINLEMGRQGLL